MFCQWCAINVISTQNIEGDYTCPNCRSAVMRPKIKKTCKNCGEETRDWDRYRGSVWCRECIVPDYRPQYNPVQYSPAHIETIPDKINVNVKETNMHLTSQFKKLGYKTDKFSPSYEGIKK